MDTNDGGLGSMWRNDNGNIDATGIDGRLSDDHGSDDVVGIGGARHCSCC